MSTILKVSAQVDKLGFNVVHRIQCKKCKVLHVGRNNKKFEYFMNGEKLDSVDSERDIGVIVDKSLKPSLQCAEAARRASGVLTSHKLLELFFIAIEILFSSYIYSLSDVISNSPSQLGHPGHRVMSFWNGYRNVL